MTDVTTDLAAPATCRALLRRDGPQSAAARAAFRAFYDAWYGEVGRWATARLAESAVLDADDLLVAAFWKAWQWIAGPSPLPAPDVLLRTCLDRAQADLLRATYGRAAANGHAPGRTGATPRLPLSLDRATPDTEALLDSLADSCDVEAQVLANASVLAHLAALPPTARACVQSRHLEGRSVAETAAHLGLTPDQVKKHTAHGLALLARRLLAGAAPDRP